MRRITILVSAFALLMSLTPPLVSQTLKEGLWDGSMTIPGEPEIQVRYRVAEIDGELNITIEGEGNRLPVHNVELDGDTLSFSWGDGLTTNCTLTLQDDGSYAGHCSRGEGPKGQVKMTPPAGE